MRSRQAATPQLPVGGSSLSGTLSSLRVASPSRCGTIADTRATEVAARGERIINRAFVLLVYFQMSPLLQADQNIQMSGRGRGGGGSSNTMRNVANALGIARYDMAKMMSQQKIETPALYPKVQRDPVPLEMTTDMLYVSRLKVELTQRMRDSQFFIEAEKEDEIKRYLDKYSIIKREKLDIDMTQLPTELVWRRTGKSVKDPEAKRRKINNDDSLIKEKLKKLEEKEGQNNEEDEEEKKDEDNDTGSEKSAAEEEENPLSDDDNAEEDNDYISNYFDNGEGYGDGGSDDNMDGDEY